MGESTGKSGSAPAADVTSGIARDPSTSVMMGDPLAKEKPKATTKDGAAVSMNTEDGRVRRGANEPGDPPPEEAEGEGEEGELEEEPGEGEGEESGEEGGEEEEGGEGEGEEGDDESDLGDYDPDNTEIVDKFEAAYTREDGSLNMERLSTEWWGNSAKEGAEGGALNDATYDFLQDAYGLSKADVQQVEQGMKALADQSISGLYERAGGQERFDAALAWGRDGGYTPEQRQRFNTILQSGDPEAINDAVDALAARYERATGDRQGRSPRRRREGRRPSAPERNATRTAPRTQPTGFKDRAEYRAARKEAEKAGDPSKVQAVRDKLRRSTFFREEG